jgi:PAS domain S-box-containing protein
MLPSSLSTMTADSNFKTLLEDGGAMVCRGLHRIKGGTRNVLAVMPASEAPAGNFRDRLRHEYELREALDSSWAATPLELVAGLELFERQCGPVLLLEDPGGEFLEKLLGQPMPAELFLRLALGLARATRKLHQQGLIHKDIKPAHILVDQASGAAWLTGFGIATRLLRERTQPGPPELIAGTLAYMAPEQTGRMNRSLDARGDLYALGVTFYRMLTGSLPFTASDPMEWVHCHIARKPAQPRALVPTIPPPISAMVMKLLAKTVEERYQTAAGLERDLERCLADWGAHGRIEAFPLGENDTPDRLLIPEKLYGREREVGTLLAAFDRVVKTGRPELVLVSGYSGVGKSSVVNELHKVLVPPRGLFASGKFDQYKRGIPYATLAQAFRRLIHPLLGKSDAELASWREALYEALGPNGRLMVDLVPELELIIGEQPQVEPLEPQQTQARFQLVFRRFLGVFARPEHPLALFLDDLQWLDGATLDLLADLLIDGDVRHLLLIGAYRDNEVDAVHPLRRKLAAIRTTGAPVQEITLAPLAPEDVGQLVADALRCEPERTRPLAQLVHRKTAGNPFFTIQFLMALAEEGLVSFDHAAARWSWDLTRIHAKGYTGNVVDLMAGKLTRLPDNTQKALQQLACLGNFAGIASLSLIHGTSDAEVQADLQEAIRLELVVRVNDSYKFSHDRIQEAAYALIPQDGRAAAHLRIGRLLLAHTPPQKREASVFEIVSQLNRGAGLMDSQEEREQLAELNLIAGKRAKASTAYTSASAYLNAGAAQLADDCWERRYELIFQLELELAECEFLTAEMAAAEERLTTLWRRAANNADQAAVACLRMDLYTALNQCQRGVAAGLDYLRQVGVSWPAHPSEEEARREYERIWRRLGSRTIEQLIDLPLMSDPALLATLDVLIKLKPSAMYTDANLFCLVISKAVNFSLEHGNSDGACWAYVSLGTIAGPYFGDYKAGFQFGQLGYEMVERRGLKRFLARTYMNFANQVLPWAKHVGASRDLLHCAFEAANKIGDLCYAAPSRSVLITNLLMAGDPLPEVQREAEAGLAFTRKVRYELMAEAIASKLGLIRTLRGLTWKFGCFDDEQFEERQFEHHLSSMPGRAFAACCYWVRKLQARFFAGDHAAAIEAASRAEPLLWTSLSQLEMAEYHLYSALARAACCDSAAATERRKHLEALTAHLRQLEIWAENCPENFENRAALVAAELARVEGRPLDAERLYEAAIKSADANGFVHNEALANELTARFFLGRGLERTGLAHLRDARACYALWGADGKIKQLDRQYPHLALLRSRLTPAAGDPALQQLDVSTVVKASNAVSGEIELPKLIQTLMTIALENAGADRGLLILPRAEGYCVEVEAKATRAGVDVRLGRSAIEEAACPESVINYVIRTHKSVILDDGSRPGSRPGMDFKDAYLRNGGARSVFCLPLLRRSELGGVLYLENSQATYAFTPDRISVLDVLAAQAAISLEKARLYGELKEREARIRRLVDANIIGIIIWTMDGQIVEANEAFLAMVGYGRDDLASERLSWVGITPPEWQDADREALAQLKESGICRPLEKEYFRKDGSRVPVLVGAALFQGSQNEGVAFILDLTERKEAERRQQVMVDELNHRVKNTLATVMALSTQTFRTAPSPEAFCEAFEGRLLALSQTHNLLNRSFWTGAGLRDILTLELAPYAGADGRGFTLDGDDLKLGPVMAVTLGMVFHELATNAVKYGALSVAGGNVLVAWRKSRPDRLHVEWRETGGPPVSPPQRRGFGSRLIEQALAGDLDGDARLFFPNEGVRCCMDIPLAHISIR